MDYDSVLTLLTALKAEKKFAMARQVAEHARLSGRHSKPEQTLKLRQQQALCTYKDEESATEERLQAALAVLLDGPPTERLPLSGHAAETLSLAGAIYKRLWEATGRRDALEQSAHLYIRAFTVGQAAKSVDDWSYAAINAAFILDVLAREIDRAAAVAADPNDPGTFGLNLNGDQFRRKAADFRQAVIDRKSDVLATAENDWWGFATVAEAQLGLGHVPDAEATLRDGLKAGGAADWELESTARQLAVLAELRDPKGGIDGNTLTAITPLVPPRVARTLSLGRIGLALSGGGFRASFYHVGVLARLAEMDVLRWIDTLSCVSGGSITGALYYLVLRRKLQSQAELTREDYVAVVRSVADILTKAAASSDLRTRAALRSLPPCAPSWTEELARLFEREILAPAAGDAASGPLHLKALRIIPAGDREGKNFRPRLHNWRRLDRVPMLVINATTLNTGHNWQFTASWMGEPPLAIDPAVDASGRLRRFYLDDETVPAEHRDITLGTAVAASACVPFPFTPIAFKGLYPDRVVRLVDGGVHDNQGLFGLDAEGCSVMVVSDGSGQLQTKAKPSAWLPKVVYRSNDVLMQAGRRSLYQLYDSRRRGSRLRDLVYVHMKKGIEEPDVTWTGGTEPPKPKLSPRSTLHPEVQKILAETRTDLDCFSPVLAQSLMYAGYVLAEEELAGSAPAALASSAAPVDWPFLSVAARAACAPADYLRALRPAHGKIIGSLLSVWDIVIGRRPL